MVKRMDLFYYTNARTLLKILTSFQIKMSVLSRSSDLRERNFFRYFVKPEEGIGEKEAKKLADKSRYVCFCTEPNDSGWYHLDKGYRLPNMWDAYADRHKGACIILDRDLFKKKNPCLTDFQIDYKIEIELKEDLPLEKKMKQKSKIYESEHEIRFISSNGSEFCDIEGCIKKILIGVDFENVYIRDEEELQTPNSFAKLCEIIKDKNIEPTLFIQPLITKAGKMIKSDNGCLLWDKMKTNGIVFNI